MFRLIAKFLFFYVYRFYVDGAFIVWTAKKTTWNLIFFLSLPPPNGIQITFQFTLYNSNQIFTDASQSRCSKRISNGLFVHSMRHRVITSKPVTNMAKVFTRYVQRFQLWLQYGTSQYIPVSLGFIFIYFIFFKIRATEEFCTATRQDAYLESEMMLLNFSCLSFESLSPFTNLLKSGFDIFLGTFAEISSSHGLLFLLRSLRNNKH